MNIKKELTDTEKNIRLCWSINNATQVALKHLDTDQSERNYGALLDEWTDFYLYYFDLKKAEVWPEPVVQQETIVSQVGGAGNSTSPMFRGGAGNRTVAPTLDQLAAEEARQNSWHAVNKGTALGTHKNGVIRCYKQNGDAKKA